MIVSLGHNATVAKGEGQLPGGNGEDARKNRTAAESNWKDATREGECTVGTRFSQGEMGKGAQHSSEIDGENY